MWVPSTPIDQPLLNRELSWLDFNERVLAQAREADVPLLERVKFVAICSNNLDEFFQVRVAALKDQIAAGVGQLSLDGLTPARQLARVLDRVRQLVRRQEDVFLGELMPLLAAADLHVLPWSELDVDDQKHLSDIYERRIHPVLTPLAFDPGHPFPYISNLSLNLGVMVADPDTRERRFARVKVPSFLPRLFQLPDGRRFVPVEEVIGAHLGQLFPGMRIAERSAFRVTRNADLTLEDEDAEDLLAAVEVELRRRRFGKAVRLEIGHRMSAEMLHLLLDELDLEPDEVTSHQALLDLSGLFVLHAIARPELKDEPWPAVTPPALAIADGTDLGEIFGILRERDVFVHHPYESFADSVEAFVERAADDPKVQSIKMTMYRTSGDSPFATSLIRAAERGVQVAVVVELQARFDEQRNIGWAKAMERSGVHVVYGFVGLKTHAKCILVVREDEDGLRRYGHLGTGNYNSRTARLYEDVGLLTSDPDITTDIGNLFNHLTGYSREVEYRKLVVAPHQLRSRLTALIEQEAGHGADGGITAKMNALADVGMINSLYRASQAGVPIDLSVRGICCLRPGVEGMSSTIRVRSVLGRYLEHSRIYRFANGSGPGEPLYLFGSADMMQRNLDMRVETLVPIENPVHQARLDQILDGVLADDIRSWVLGSDAVWRQQEGDDLADAQARLAAH